MPGPSSRFIDDVAKLVTDAAGMAQGVRREAETVVKTQTERLLATMNVVTREEFEVVREMAARARDENNALLRRIALLESLARDENDALERRIAALEARLEPVPPPVEAPHYA